MAASGTSEIALARACATASKDMVLAGLDDPLEAAQTVVLLLFVALFRTIPESVPQLLVAGRAALASLCLDDSGRFSAAVREPRTAEEWIRADSALRCWCVFSGLDNGISSWFGEKALFDATACPVPLPAHERFFDHPDPQAAFDSLRAAGAFGPGRFADISAFAAIPTAEVASGPIRRIVRAIFSGQASCVAIFGPQGFSRSLRSKLRVFAREREVNPLTIICKPRDQLTADEVTYCGGLDLADAVVRCFVEAMPEAVSGAMLAGNPVPFLSAPCFVHPGHAHVVFAMSLVVFSTWLEAAADAQQGPPPASAVLGFFESPTFLRVMDRAQTISELLENLREEDIPWLHPSIGVHGVRVGVISLALFDAIRSDPAAAFAAERLRRNVQVIARVLASMGGKAPNMAKIAADFLRAARAVGALPNDFPETPVSENGQGEPHAPFAGPESLDPTSPLWSLSKALGQLDRGIAEWLPTLEDWMRAASGHVVVNT
ncbi:hypothetical protein DFJ74DRAFT_701201 [Hyaloraphidium curvatum]|nr:hypothetical protein DFJ74DRAFT_701201 [Hyaloraphidium curvatum]